MNQTTKPSQADRYKFFHYLSTDETGKLGKTYTEFEPILSYFLTITPEEFYAYYLQYKTHVLHNNADPNTTEDSKNMVWLYANSEEHALKLIREIYHNIHIKENEILVDGQWVPDNRPPIFRLALNLWLYIWH